LRLNQAAPPLAKAHRIIFNAIGDRDAAAEPWMRRHMVNSRRGFELPHLDMEKTVDLPLPWWMAKSARTSIIDSLSASP
jgi:hypothetical protein